MLGGKAVISIVGILILGTIGQSQIVEAQDLSLSDNVSKKFQKMDSSLAELYELKSQGKVLPFSMHISADGEKVRVVIELIDVGIEIPQNLGIEVETSYENMFQAMVPIQNLQNIIKANIILKNHLISNSEAFRPKSKRLSYGR